MSVVSHHHSPLQLLQMREARKLHPVVVVLSVFNAWRLDGGMCVTGYSRVDCLGLFDAERVTTSLVQRCTIGMYLCVSRADVGCVFPRLNWL